MMYYREALKLQAFLDVAEDEDILEGYDAVESRNRVLSAQLDAIADMKFTYVLSCQLFGSQKASGDPHAQDIIDLMIRYPSLRVAYVEEKEEMVENKPRKVYSSVLVKAVNGFDQEIYRIKLPGPPTIGEGKPENQNHGIIFTRGEALQTIDMNQDSYLEEALKMKNLLQEFLQNQGRRPPALLGLREHVFTGSVSSLAWFMSYQETSFVTIGQRLLAYPLRVRFHYGHPDVFDRLFHITRGGISKASKTINLSEDVFAGFNCTLRRGCITYHEYMQVGKGRDVSLNQISKFEAKVANGNSEQTLSRDIYHLGRQFDFFRMLSCYFTTIGFYFSSLMSIIGIYVFLYGQLYLVLSGLEKALIIEARLQNIQSLETALASQSFIQLGLLTGLPMVMEIGLEKGFLNALKDFVLMQLQLASVFFTFSFGTKIHYYGRTILHGGAKYRPTGRKVVVFHASFTENYRLYSRSHFVKGFELLLLLTVYDLFRRSYQSNMAYVLITYSIWFMSITWLFAPFLFNPSGFSWEKIVDDWKDWNKWIRQQGGIGVQQDKSWQSWWIDEQAHLRRSGMASRVFEILLSVRFFLYQYGLVYHLDISQNSRNFLVYLLSWIVILAVFLIVKAVNLGRQQFSARYHLVFRLFKAFLFLGVLSVILALYFVCKLSWKDILVCSLAFFPTGWGLILFAQAVRPLIENTGLWEFTRVLAKTYDYGMGVALFAPIAVFSWLPILSAFQTRFLFNEAFNRHLQIQPILAGKKKNR
ncbi:putative callose synthase 8 [Prunus yedoensis var. nudiflora]|uniref:Putative callose synthase 8 n=1 Tax=Prunus yedoensis var. nudiflora TaxID=2094558 RepID=A0A314Z636_PRUYE|nr:putative callose synthase 8 [Prunus yedoensis var. nudiflora]